MRFREIEKIVLNDGWELVDVRGSHHQYKHPTKTGKVTIPNHRGDIPQKFISLILCNFNQIIQSSLTPAL